MPWCYTSNHEFPHSSVASVSEREAGNPNSGSGAADSPVGESAAKANDRQPLELDDTLASLARAHSEDMTKRGYFKHVNPEGETPMNRLQKAGYDKCRLVGENIYQNNLYSSVTT